MDPHDYGSSFGNQKRCYSFGRYSVYRFYVIILIGKTKKISTSIPLYVYSNLVDNSLPKKIAMKFEVVVVIDLNNPQNKTSIKISV